MAHEKNWRVSLCVQELCHPQNFLWILAAIPICHRSHRSISWSWFLLGFWIFDGLGLTTGHPVLSFQHVYLTQLRDRNPSPHGSHRSCLITLSLDTVGDVIVGEVDELEEDVGWSISSHESVFNVDEGKREEQLVPGSKIGTKFSVLHCNRIPFLMRCGFQPLIHS